MNSIKNKFLFILVSIYIAFNFIFYGITNNNIENNTYLKFFIYWFLSVCFFDTIAYKLQDKENTKVGIKYVMFIFVISINFIFYIAKYQTFENRNNTFTKHFLFMGVLSIVLNYYLDRKKNKND